VVLAPRSGTKLSPLHRVDQRVAEIGAAGLASAPLFFQADPLVFPGDRRSKPETTQSRDDDYTVHVRGLTAIFAP
jgi:hypothetical protein